MEFKDLFRLYRNETIQTIGKLTLLNIASTSSFWSLSAIWGEIHESRNSEQIAIPGSDCAPSIRVGDQM